MKTSVRALIRAVTIVVLLAGVGGVAAAQRGWVDVGIGRRPWVRGEIIIGTPRYHYRYHYRPFVHRPHAYRHYYRQPVVVRPRFYYRRPVVIHRGHRSHYRWY